MHNSIVSKKNVSIIIEIIAILLYRYWCCRNIFTTIDIELGPGTAQERDWKLNIKTVRMWPSNLLFIVAYFINFKLEFLSIGSTKWLEIWYSCYILPNSEKILLRKVKIMAYKAHVRMWPRIPILNPGYVINFQLEILCNGLI